MRGLMTIDAVRRKSTRASRREQREGMPIGENDANIFDCPACARPLATGTRRCPGCSTRLLGGVRATRAAGFMAIGLLIGLFVGGSVVGLVAMLSAPAAATAATTDPVAGPTSAPLATAPVSVPVADPAVPAAALTALSQTSLINQRLQADATRLQAVMAGSAPASVDIARALRSLSATAAFGDRIAPDVADWADGTAVSASLAAFYAAVGATAREGLTSSLQNADAYRDAGRSMLAVLDELAELDADSRALAATADTDLPALGPAASAAP
jgi:hypothetical protein